MSQLFGKDRSNERVGEQDNEERAFLGAPPLIAGIKIKYELANICAEHCEKFHGIDFTPQEYVL
ncbi:MAG: hypothetical protein R2877_08165 [Bdellovibrionota bacterium]